MQTHNMIVVSFNLYPFVVTVLGVMRNIDERMFAHRGPRELQVTWKQIYLELLKELHELYTGREMAENIPEHFK